MSTLVYDYRAETGNAAGVDVLGCLLLVALVPLAILACLLVAHCECGGSMTHDEWE